MICNILSNCTNHYINVGNSEEIISQSYKQAEMKEFIYKCYVRNLNMLKGYLPNEVQRMIAAEDIAGAVAYFGGQRENKKISDIVIEKEEYNIRQLEASLIYHSQLDNQSKIKEYTDKIDKAKASLTNLKNKIQEIENEECPICYSDFDNDKALTSCCKFILCGGCIKNLVLTSNKCPFCRNQIEIKDLIVSTNKTFDDEKKERCLSETLKKSKLEVAVEIIKSNPNGKFLLFSEYWNTFNMISETLTENNISWAEIKGTTDMKQKYIKQFKEGHIKVLFLNARHDGTGINLPETTDIILYHKVSNQELETQIFGRALRLGRTSPLKVHRLLAEGETHIINNNQNQTQQINTYDSQSNNLDDEIISDNENDFLDIIDDNDNSRNNVDNENNSSLISNPNNSNNYFQNEYQLQELRDNRIRIQKIKEITESLNHNDFSTHQEMVEYATAIYESSLNL